VTPDFWIDRWQRGETGFHRTEVHDLLARHWPAVGAAPGSTVFVPLCGKSRDMVWLAAAGHRIVGVELSPLAIDDFFREQRMEATTRAEGQFTVHTDGPFEIWCGDIFKLPKGAVRDVAAVYDRAALVALPPTLQRKYAETLTALVPAAPILLTSLSYPDGEMSGPPFSTPLSQVAELFGMLYEIAIAESRDGLEESQNLKDRGVTALEEVAYILRRKAISG
jgi:thiopurine S-methyltransferase